MLHHPSRLGFLSGTSQQYAVQVFDGSHAWVRDPAGTHDVPQQMVHDLEGNLHRDTVAALVKWSTPLMVSGPQGDSFHGEWLVVALDALMEGRSANEPTTIGLGVDDTVVAVRVDETGAQVDFDGHERPDTVFRGAPEVVLGLASGVLTVDQAVAVGDLHGRKADLVAVFGSR